MQLPNEVFATRRAQWLAELSGALGEARHLMREFDLPDAHNEAMALCLQIDELRREVDAMRLRRLSRETPDLGPEWMNSPWHAAKPIPPKPGAGCEVQVDA